MLQNVSDTLLDRIDEVVIPWAEELAQAMNDSLNAALKKGAMSARHPYKPDVQNAALHFEPDIKIEDNKLTVRILASGPYWRQLEYGRGKTKSSTGSGAVEKGVGKEWQAKHNIDAVEEMFKIQLEYNKNNGLNYKPKRLERGKAIKALAYIRSRGIHMYGFKARPFIAGAQVTQRVEVLKKALAKIIGKEIVANIIIK